ncbi:WbuC family cupin fold metalloprotein [Steroidobacter cummioxidans]|uniref:WbuC family cupin fold metalloprotein n=1 Tax=Steroidobacter cummioxidans TaxID=1803913 RepID=UPI000E324ED7|nr:WbuC family cupin fold metalloprotein [Steroidobacter cummioxidans]
MKLISNALLDEITAKAAASPRRRAHHNLHSSPSDLVQRFVVVAQSDTYIRPHRHLTKSELCTVVRGQFEVVVFDTDGTITHRSVVGEGTPNLAFELPQATWHTLLALTDGAAFVEVKEGPYDPATAAEFAGWAPEEGRATADFQRWVQSAPVGARVPSFT